MTIIDKAFKGISIIQFYKYGSILFSVGIIGSALNTKVQWITLTLGGKISMISSFLFQCLLLTLFLTLYFQTKKVPVVVDNPEIDNFLKKLKLEDEVKGGKKKKDEQKNNIKN